MRGGDASDRSERVGREVGEVKGNTRGRREGKVSSFSEGRWEVKGGDRATTGARTGQGRTGEG